MAKAFDARSLVSAINGGVSAPEIHNVRGVKVSFG